MTINIKNLTKLINHLRRTKPKTFNMGLWLAFDWDKEWMLNPASKLVERIETKGDCGTVACIAGHAALLIAAEQKLNSGAFRGMRARDEAKEWLGLDDDQANALFVPRDGDEYIVRYSRDQAITTLEHLKETAEMGAPEIVWPEHPDGEQ